MNTNIEVLRELDELVEAARLLGVTQAKRGFGCHTDEDRRFERAMYESIDKHRAALLDWVAKQPAPQRQSRHMTTETDLLPQPAEPVKCKRRYAQGTALGEFGILPMCDQVDDETVKVPSDEEIDAIVSKHFQLPGNVSGAYAVIAEVLLSERMRRMAKDAARYRWLRDPCSGAERVIFYCRGDYGRGLMSGSMLDAAIDEAMEGEKGQ